jgi:non-heme chloroperoxidase
MTEPFPLGRRQLLGGTMALAATAHLTAPIAAATLPGQGHLPASRKTSGVSSMTQGSYLTTRDGTSIFFKDWGPRNAQPIVFHHGGR